jgi:hypothetical protein
MYHIGMRTGTLRIFHYAHQAARGKIVMAIIAALLANPLARWILSGLHTINWKDIASPILTIIIAVVILYAYYVAYYWFKRDSLDDPPRTLPYQKRKKIAEHLRPYGQTNSPQVSVFACEGVKDAKDFAESISQALRDANWQVEFGGLADFHDERSIGVWIEGRWENARPDWPPMDLALKDALTAAGIKVRIEGGSKYEYLILVIGKREY